MMKPAPRNLSGTAPLQDAMPKSAVTTFDELLCAVRKIDCEESREQTDCYCEIVVATAHLPAVISLLQSYFGVPLKPQGQKPSAEANTYAEPYGGIYDGQTLYLKKQGAGPELALLWPWGSGASTTVKLIRG
jgi:hypothetical protein